jgi:4-amino-4-deoxy-L-arabinose transferase-like glycosyltransferase
LSKRASQSNRRVDPFMTYRSRIALVLLMGFMVCAAVDLVYFPNAPVFPDESRFLDSAQLLVTTGEFRVGTDRAFEMPGTAIFLSAFVSLFGPHAAIIPARVAQGLLVAIQAALVGLMAFRIFGDKLTASIAVTITCFYPFLIYFQGLLLSETLFNTFLVAAFVCLYWWHGRGMRLDIALLLTCILFAAAAMTKATLTLLPPFLLAATVICERRQFATAVRVLAVSGLVYCLLLAPWAIRNYSVLGQFVPFTTSAGLNLYLGNNPANRGGGVDWAHDTEPERVKAFMAIPNEIDKNKAFTAAAVDYIAQHPVDFLKRAGQKFLRYWNPIPNADSFRSIVFVLISAVSFAPILVLAIVSAIRNRRRFGALAPIYLLIGYFTLLHMVVIASIRYRLPLEPFLILLACEPIALIVARLTGRTQAAA